MIAIISIYMTPAGDSYDQDVATFDDTEHELADKIRQQLEDKEDRQVRYEIYQHKCTPLPPHNPQSVEDVKQYWAEEEKRFKADV